MATVVIVVKDREDLATEVGAEGGIEFKMSPRDDGTSLCVIPQGQLTMAELIAHQLWHHGLDVLNKAMEAGNGVTAHTPEAAMAKARAKKKDQVEH